LAIVRIFHTDGCQALDYHDAHGDQMTIGVVGG